MQPDVPILTPELGINVNDKHQAFTDQILSGAKTIETRSAPTLHPYIGKKMGLVRTGKGKAMLVGYVTIGEPKLYTAESSFDSDFDSHLVGKDSPFHISKSKKGSKWGYTLSDVEKVEPRLLKDGTGVAPNPRVARRLQKIADHVRVKLARTPSQPATAESFGSLWHMARTPNAHVEDISGGTLPFIHPDPSSGVWNTETADQVRSSPSAVHFVAHHPNQLNPQIISEREPNEPSIDVYTGGETDDPSARRRRSHIISERGERSTFFDSIARSSSGFGSIIDDLERRRGLRPGSLNREQRNSAIDDVINGQGHVRRLVGIARRSDGVEPTVYFKSYRAAKLAAMLTGGHVESVSFDPKTVANSAINTSKNGPYTNIRLPTIFDIRNGIKDASFSDCLLPDQRHGAGTFYQIAPHVLAKHPIFGEYMTIVGERNPANTGPGSPVYHGFIDRFNSHRAVQLHQNNWRPNSDTIASYGHPPLHFNPDAYGRRSYVALDDVGRELHAQVVANPGDHLARAVLADHLDSIGHHEHADNWRQTLPLKFRKNGAPVRYAAEQDDVPSSTLPSSNPASTSFGSTKDWLVKNDPHPMWLNGRRTSEVAATNVGPVRHLSHDDSQLSAVHFVAGHPAQMSPISTFDLNFPAQGIKVLGIRNPERGLRGPEASSYLPEHNVSYNFGGEPSQEFTRDSERDFLDRVRGGAMQVNREILDELGVKGATTVNGIDVQDAFTPLFKDRDAAERMANSVGGYVHTIHIDPSRLRGRKSPLGSQTYGGTVYPELLSNDRFQLIDNRASGTPPTNLRQSVITLSKHPEHGEYILAHNMRHLTKDTFSQRSNHFSGSLSKAERFGVNSGGVPSRGSAYSGWWADQARKSHIVPLISQYWRNLIDLHSEHHNDPWNEDYNLPMVLSADGIGGDYTPPTRQLINSMGDAAQHLYAMALADRNDHLPRMVLADMFDEHGHDGAANFMRASIPHHVRRQLKLAKGEKPDANWQPKPGADVEVHSDESGNYPTSGFYKGPSSIPGKHIVVKQNDDGDIRKSKVPEHQIYAPGGFAHMGPSVAQQQISPETASKPSGGMDETWRQISDLLAWPGGIRQQPEQQPQKQSVSIGDRVHLHHPSGHRVDNGVYTLDDMDKNYYTLSMVGENVLGYQRGIRIPRSDAQLKPAPAEPSFQKGEGAFPTWVQGSDINPQVEQFPAPPAPLRHPEISARVPFVGNEHLLEPGDIIHTYINDSELMHRTPRMFTGFHTDESRPADSIQASTFRSQRINLDGTTDPVSFAAPSHVRSNTIGEIPSFAIIQRAETTRARQAAGLPPLAEPNEPAPRQLNPEQIAEAHFSANDPVLVRSDDGTVNNGVYSHPYFDPESGRLMHAVDMSVTGSRKGVAPESVWHRRGDSSLNHPAFAGPQSWPEVSTLDQLLDRARVFSRVWVNTANPRVGLMSPTITSQTTDYLNNYRRATVLMMHPNRNSLSVRFDGGEDPVEVHHGRVRLDLSRYGQFPAHVDAFPGSPVSVIDSASGRVYHGLYRGSSPTSSEAGVSHLASLRDAGANESWLDPSRSNEQHAHLVDIQDEHGPLTVAVERSDLLPRFARGVMHDWGAEHPQSSARTLNIVADSIERDQPDLANRMRENASRLSGMPNPITVTPVQAGLPPAAPAQSASRAQSPASAKSSKTSAGAPPVEKKLERMIFNAGERNYDDVAESLRDKFSEMFGEEIDDQTIMDILRVPRAFPGSDPNHPAFSPENLSLDLGIYSDSVSSTVRSKLPNYKFHANTGVGSGDVSNQSQSHSGMKGTHDKFISTPHILQNQANAAHRLGINKLKVNAALTNPVIDPHNGYTGGIVWPTYGYTKDLERINDWDDVQLAEAIAIARRNNPDLHAIDDSELTLNHLLDSKEGIDWYTQNEPHRHGGKHYLNATSGHMVFHTDPNSISHRILARKVRRLEQNAASRSSPS